MAVEPATAVAFAGLEKMLKNGTIRPDETVVVNCTGHTFPVEKHVLGDQFAVDVHLSEDQSPAPREGLQAALENLDEKTTTVLLIDDNEDDALLIRRLLEARKTYRVYHARDGWEGLGAGAAETARPDRQRPDDAGHRRVWPGGRTQTRPAHAGYPRRGGQRQGYHPEERKRLNGHIEAVYQKGSLPTRKFVDQVIQVIEDKSANKEMRIMGNNILYIEDNPDNMMLVKRALEARGYRLLQAENGVKGVAVAESEDVDLILLDINLPDIDGYEVARRIRSSTEHSWPTRRSSPSPPTR